MQFVKDGPDLPNSLVHEHVDGRIVFFCGAGISYPQGCPGLANIWTDYTPRFTRRPPLESKALEQERFEARQVCFDFRWLCAHAVAQKSEFRSGAFKCLYGCFQYLSAVRSITLALMEKLF